MNDKSVSALEHYDFEVHNIVKGRGMFICETSIGKMVLEPYQGMTDKLPLLERLHEKLQTAGFPKTDRIVRSKEGELFCSDYEGTTFIVKQYCEGRECSVKNIEELIAAMALLGKLHKTLEQCTLGEFQKMKLHVLLYEITHHNQELKRIRRYLRNRSDKTDFERALLEHYGFFLQKALWLEEQLKDMQYQPEQTVCICHGDYQYHNVLIQDNGQTVINFESFRRESMIKDVYLFTRKVMEKYNWSYELWKELIGAYQNERILTEVEWRELYNRLFYPEKFWKIVNFYYNSRKSWQPEKNLEKLKKVVEQEEEKEKLLCKIRKHID